MTTIRNEKDGCEFDKLLAPDESQSCCVIFRWGFVSLGAVLYDLDFCRGAASAAACAGVERFGWVHDGCGL